MHIMDENNYLTTNQPYITPEDLIQKEETLKGLLANLVTFESATIFFPQHPPLDMTSDSKQFKTIYREEDNNILIPLVNAQRLLGILILKDVSTENPLLICPYLDQYILLCLENISLEKTSQYDPLTALLNEHSFMCYLTQYLENISIPYQCNITETLDHQIKGFTGQLGLIVMNVNGMGKINSDYGYLFGDSVLKELANHLKSFSKETTLISRLKNDLFAILLANEGAQKCLSIAKQLKLILRDNPIEDPMTHIQLHISLCIGYTVYPNDFSGKLISTIAPEKAHWLLENAFTALKRSQGLNSTPIIGFSDIIQHSGLILDRTTPETLQTDLGSDVQAREGDHFFVFSSNTPELKFDSLEDNEKGFFKGEIILTKVYERSSLAEILYLQNPKQDIHPGDRLLLHENLEQEQIDIEPCEQEQSVNSSTLQILSLRNFFASWQRESMNTNKFCLAICNCKLPTEVSPYEDRPTEESNLEDFLAWTLPPKIITGRYGYHSLIIFFPEYEQEQVKPWLEDLNQRASEEHSLLFHIGLAQYPCLFHSKRETMTNCKKALEHAKLLKAPVVVCFDSLSQTIYADRVFNQGNIAQALSEYQVALLQDPQSNLARNSLGICHAYLGEKDAAYKEFEKIVYQEPNNTMGLYNLGYLCMKLGDHPQAKSLFEHCLNLSKEKSYCLLRLGQISESLKRYQEAKDYYFQACEYKEGKKYAYRYLAQTELALENKEKARTLLHKAITHNPFDAEAIYLLAHLYQQQDEDMGLIESLIKKSLALRPKSTRYLLFLENILVQQGKREEIRALQSRKLNGFSRYSLMPT